MKTYLYIQEEFEMFGKAESFEDAKKTIIKSLKRDLDKNEVKQIVAEFKKNPHKYLKKCTSKELERIRSNFLALNSR